MPLSISVTAVILLAHGSAAPETRDEILLLCERLRSLTGQSLVQPAFLGSLDPDFASAVTLCLERGAGRILILPHFLNSGGHVMRDIPRLVEEQKKRFPGTTFDVAQPLGLQEEIAGVYARLIHEGNERS